MQKILILQHPQEPGHQLGSVPLIQSALGKRVAVRIGLSWANLAKALGPEAPAKIDPKKWGVLYLGSGIKGDTPPWLLEKLSLQKKTKPSDRKSFLCPVNKQGFPPHSLEETKTLLKGLEGLIVLDGTWSQAKALWWRNAWLLKAQRLILMPGQASLYGKMRREPRRECLSTLESVAYTLSTLGESESTERKLLESFEAALLHKKSGSAPKEDSAATRAVN